MPATRVERQAASGRQRRLRRHDRLSRRWPRARQPATPAASTDTGHTGPAANTFANDDVTLDFAYRAIHETTVAAKRVVDRVLRRGAALRVLQRLLDRRPSGAHGGAAISPTTSTASSAARRPSSPPGRRSARSGSTRRLRSGEGAIPKREAAADSRRGAGACDALDGAKDGVLENPLACTFDPGVLACKPAPTRRLPHGAAGRRGRQGVRRRVARRGRARRSSPASSVAASWVGRRCRSATRWTISSTSCSRTRPGIRRR